ncbi:MAG: CsgG/HfaB family protein [Verrucomicrobiota bacterium]
MRKLMIVLSVVLCVGTSFAEESSKPTMFVAPLDGDMSQIQGWQPALGEGLAEMLITELTKTGKFDVLESTALSELKSEIDLGEDGYVEEGEKVKKGGYAAADFMFRGKVTRFGSKKQNINLGGFIPGSFGDLGVKTSESDVRIDWRIVDTATRKILKSGKAVGVEEGVGFDVGVAVDGHGGNIGFGNQEFMNSALGKATVKALDQIMAEVETVSLPTSGRFKAKEKAAAQQAAELKATTGKVLAVPSKSTIIISLGEKHGLKMGDKVKLYQTVDTKDAQGNVVFTEEKLVGELVLETVQDDRSKAAYSGNENPQAGWVVKME